MTLATISGKTTRRQRHIVVLTRGNLLAIWVHPANIHDREGAEYALRAFLTTDCSRLAKILGDKGSRREDLDPWVDEVLAVLLELVGGIPEQRGFLVHLR